MIAHPIAIAAADAAVARETVTRIIAPPPTAIAAIDAAGARARDLARPALGRALALAVATDTIPRAAATAGTAGTATIIMIGDIGAARRAHGRLLAIDSTTCRRRMQAMRMQRALPPLPRVQSARARRRRIRKRHSKRAFVRSARPVWRRGRIMRAVP